MRPSAPSGIFSIAPETPPPQRVDGKGSQAMRKVPDGSDGDGVVVVYFLILAMKI